MQRLLEEGRLLKRRRCPDCPDFFHFSEQERPIKMLLDGKELEGATFMEGRLMGRLEGEWVDLPMPKRCYLRPHTPMVPWDSEMIQRARDRWLEIKLYPDEFQSVTLSDLTEEEQEELDAEVDRQYDEAERRIEAKREERASGRQQEGLGKILFWRCEGTIRF